MSRNRVTVSYSVWMESDAGGGKKISYQKELKEFVLTGLNVPLPVVRGTINFFRCGHRLMIFQLFIRFFNSFQYFIISKNSQLRNMQPLSNLWRITVQFHISVHISHAFFLFPLGLN